nr:MAG TPA: hypothetical protein [Caudoviricetes sp.]
MNLMFQDIFSKVTLNHKEYIFLVYGLSLLALNMGVITGNVLSLFREFKKKKRKTVFFIQSIAIYTALDLVEYYAITHLDYTKDQVIRIQIASLLLYVVVYIGSLITMIANSNVGYSFIKRVIVIPLGMYIGTVGVLFFTRNHTLASFNFWVTTLFQREHFAYSYNKRIVDFVNSWQVSVQRINGFWNEKEIRERLTDYNHTIGRAETADEFLRLLKAEKEEYIREHGNAE